MLSMLFVSLWETKHLDKKFPKVYCIYSSRPVGYELWIGQPENGAVLTRMTHIATCVEEREETCFHQRFSPLHVNWDKDRIPVRCPTWAMSIAQLTEAVPCNCTECHWGFLQNKFTICKCNLLYTWLIHLIPGWTPADAAVYQLWLHNHHMKKNKQMESVNCELQRKITWRYCFWLRLLINRWCIRLLSVFSLLGRP